MSTSLSRPLSHLEGPGPAIDETSEHATTFHAITTDDTQHGPSPVSPQSDAFFSSNEVSRTTIPSPTSPISPVKPQFSFLSSSPQTQPKPSTVNGAASSFQGLSLDLPVDLGSELSTDNMKFSQRGSMLLDGKRVNGMASSRSMPIIEEPLQEDITKEPTMSKLQSRPAAADLITDSHRPLLTEEEQLSDKVRSYYNLGMEATEKDVDSVKAKRMSSRWQDALQNSTFTPISTSRNTSTTNISADPSTPTFAREHNELAGGLEDWQDVDAADVDRYGFIIPKSPLQTEEDLQAGIKRQPTLQRVTTTLQLASESPRRKHTIRRAPSNAPSTISAKSEQTKRSPSSLSGRPPSSKSVTMSRTRAFTNQLPQNKDRRCLDEAGDMLTLPRSQTSSSFHGAQTLNTTSSNASTPSISLAARKKEIERQEKWRKMAREKLQGLSKAAGNTTYMFDVSSPKVVDRTWKGIPDSWRASAWSSFLASSVQSHNKAHPRRPCLTDEKLVELFHHYQTKACPDDVQIDLDVPRTTSAHIMFRRRYRGGQRLLFRVLHALALYAPKTGYVQGMAALAATLLAYYDEEHSFVMLVRMWELRGLSKLYSLGFGGLMAALTDFENDWLGKGEVSSKLQNLNIPSMSFGTKWYLTLFNYSIPFNAQLRVWDVFMLLGDDPASNVVRSSEHDEDVDQARTDMTQAEDFHFHTTLSVLHATSAALIDGMRDILLDPACDFEEGMKCLTSWIPIRDEDLFMRVARAEWKLWDARRRQGKG